MKLCKNCKHHDKGICKHGSSLRYVDYVNGTGNVYWPCRIQRNHECGEHGRYYDPKLIVINNEEYQTPEQEFNDLFQKVKSWLKKKIL